MCSCGLTSGRYAADCRPVRRDDRRASNREVAGSVEGRLQPAAEQSRRLHVPTHLLPTLQIHARQHGHSMQKIRAVA